MTDLADALMNAVEQPSGWEDALAALCASVGASRALITLRDLRTADIFVPTEVSERHGSPLVHGFDPSEVFSYLSDYMNDDPWTVIERRFPPVDPYAMSQYLPPDALRKTPFWSWLEPLGIGDAIACEIGRTDRHRTILNLFLPLDMPRAQVNRAIARLVSVLPLIRKAWVIGRRFQLRGLSSDGLDSLLNAISHPSLVATCSGRVEGFNTAALSQFAAWNIDLYTGGPLHLPACLTLRAEDSVEHVIMERVSSVRRTNAVASASLFEDAELLDGEPARRILITVEPKPAAPSTLEILELTERERELVRHLAIGLTHKAAAFEMGRSYPRIMQLWRSARDKLGVSDVNDLRLIYRMEKLGVQSRS